MFHRKKFIYEQSDSCRNSTEQYRLNLSLHRASSRLLLWHNPWSGYCQTWSRAALFWSLPSDVPLSEYIMLAEDAFGIGYCAPELKSWNASRGLCMNNARSCRVKRHNLTSLDCTIHPPFIITDGGETAHSCVTIWIWAERLHRTESAGGLWLLFFF